MQETVALELPREMSLLPVVRMVVGGMAARADLSVDEIDDVYLAVEEVLHAAPGAASGRCTLRMKAFDEALRLEIGPFHASALAARLKEPCCTLVARVVSLDIVTADDDTVTLVLVKRRGSAGA